MEEKIINTTEITLRLTSHGRYTWTISSIFLTNEAGEGIKKLKELDKKLREEFPDYVQKGAGRSVNLDED